MLIRTNPQLTVLWSLSPAHSAELFEEIKLDQPNPDMAVAMAIRSDDLGRDDGSVALLPSRSKLYALDDQSPLPDADVFSAPGTSKRKLNGVLKRQLCSLPGLASGDVDRLMSSGQFKDPGELIQASIETLAKAAGGNRKQAEVLNDFFRTDFRLFAF
ncbi:ERCC4 domain containing protein [Aphelenchoides avenae]|nr:ERCC4 domain containing protein [Aphelenchus avenae]